MFPDVMFSLEILSTHVTAQTNKDIKLFSSD